MLFEYSLCIVRVDSRLVNAVCSLLQGILHRSLYTKELIRIVSDCNSDVPQINSTKYEVNMLAITFLFAIPNH